MGRCILRCDPAVQERTPRQAALLITCEANAPGRKTVMNEEACDRQSSLRISRRGVIKRLGVAAGIAAIAPRFAMAQNAQGATNASAPSTVSNPPRDFSPNAAPALYPDADVLSI